jgi:hypothetical protein
LIDLRVSNLPVEIVNKMNEVYAKNIKMSNSGPTGSNGAIGVSGVSGVVRDESQKKEGNYKKVETNCH